MKRNKILDIFFGDTFSTLLFVFMCISSASLIINRLPWYEIIGVLIGLGLIYSEYSLLQEVYFNVK